jgi:ATP-dependent RNA helicase DeaD
LGGGPKALIIAPTRELAMQVRREFEWLYGPAGGYVASCVGGMDMRREIYALEKGAQIVVGTPGRLVDHLKRGSLNLSVLEAVVMDEADEMLDLGFAEDLDTILSAAPKTKQTLMFSATVPRAIEKLAAGHLRAGYQRIAVAGEAAQHTDIAYRIAAVGNDDAERAIVNILRFHEADRAIVFANTRVVVARIAARLTNRGFRAVTISGELSQTERTHALQAMRDGRARVIVATDVAARGIDLPNLDLVIHAELPGSPESLKHRSGRTGRAGRKGTSVMIVTPRTRAKASRILQSAAIAAEWGTAPSADDVRAKDVERLMQAPVWDEVPEGDDATMTARLAAERDPQALAAALVSFWRERHSAPEEISAGTGPAQDTRTPRAPSEFGASVWFRVSKGRRDRAEAKWLLPKICQAGGITRTEVGAIRIGETASFVQIAEGAVKKFMAEIGREGLIEDGLFATRMDGAPDAADIAYQPTWKAAKAPRAPRTDSDGYAPGAERPAPFKAPVKGPVKGPVKAQVKEPSKDPVKAPYNSAPKPERVVERAAERTAPPQAPRPVDPPVAKPKKKSTYDPAAPTVTDAPAKPAKPRPATSTPYGAKPGAKPGARPASAGFKSHGGKGKPAKAQGFKSHAGAGTVSAKPPHRKGPKPPKA